METRRAHGRQPRDRQASSGALRREQPGGAFGAAAGGVEGLGYNAWWHIASYYNTHNFFGHAENIFPNHYPEANLICFPTEAKVNINLWPVEGPDDTFIKATERHSSASGESL
jgi:hypothetical protein